MVHMCVRRTPSEHTLRDNQENLAPAACTGKTVGAFIYLYSFPNFYNERAVFFQKKKEEEEANQIYLEVRLSSPHPSPCLTSLPMTSEAYINQR